MPGSSLRQFRIDRDWWLKHLMDDDVAYPYRARRLARWRYGLDGSEPVSMKVAADRLKLSAGRGHQLLKEAKQQKEKAEGQK